MRPPYVSNCCSVDSALLCIIYGLALHDKCTVFCCFFATSIRFSNGLIINIRLTDCKQRRRIASVFVRRRRTVMKTGRRSLWFRRKNCRRPYRSTLHSGSRGKFICHTRQISSCKNSYRTWRPGCKNHILLL